MDDEGSWCAVVSGKKKTRRRAFSIESRTMMATSRINENPLQIAPNEVSFFSQIRKCEILFFETHTISCSGSNSQPKSLERCVKCSPACSITLRHIQQRNSKNIINR